MKFGDPFSELPDRDDSFLGDHWEVVVVDGVAYTMKMVHDERGWWASNLCRDNLPSIVAEIRES